MVVRDPDTGEFFRHAQGVYAPLALGEELPVDPPPKVGAVLEGARSGKLGVRYDVATFQHQRTHGLKVARGETLVYYAAAAAMLGACAGPVYMFSQTAMNPHGAAIATCATLLALPVLAFSRRYLHGEPMFTRFAMLSAGLLLGFNLVATAPGLEQTMAGWGLFGFASTFLIGSYNDRSTVRNNATFAFAAYRISDFALLTAATFSGPLAAATGQENPELVAGALLMAAMWKSSQFPLTGLFARSMEGPTPTSALGYAGLSAHIGVVLLANTMPLWFAFDWARWALGSVGLYTAVHSTLGAHVRADRKGALAYATSSTLGLILTTLALGHADLALLMSLGHTAFRMNEVLRAPNSMAEAQHLRAALGRSPWPRAVPDWVYLLAWRARRLDADFNLMHLMHWISGRLVVPRRWRLAPWQQWGLTSAGVVLAGLPFTPVSHAMEELLMELLPVHPGVAAELMLAHYTLSVLIVRFLLVNVITTHDHKPSALPPTKPKQGKHQQ